jgi:hypothetical protein
MTSDMPPSPGSFSSRRALTWRTFAAFWQRRFHVVSPAPWAVAHRRWRMALRQVERLIGTVPDKDDPFYSQWYGAMVREVMVCAGTTLDLLIATPDTGSSLPTDYIWTRQLERARTLVRVLRHDPGRLHAPSVRFVITAFQHDLEAISSEEHPAGHPLWWRDLLALVDCTDEERAALRQWWPAAGDHEQEEVSSS